MNMGRIEEIAEKWSRAQDIMSYSTKTIAEAPVDVIDLLSRLQIAQEALKKAYDLDGYMFIKEALEQIQKEG
jgi:hypothetical protein